LKKDCYRVIDQVIDQFPDVAEKISELHKKIDEGVKSKLNQKFDFLTAKVQVLERIPTEEGRKELSIARAELNYVQD
jgi:Mg2+ and Co2+ transporter CorA